MNRRTQPCASCSHAIRKMPVYRWIAVLMLLLHLGACTTWRPVTLSPRQFIEEEQPDRIRVWRQGERATEVRGPRIDGDILTSTVPTEPPVGIALTDVTLMEVRGFNYPLLLLAVLGAGVAGLLLFCGDDDYCDLSEL